MKSISYKDKITPAGEKNNKTKIYDTQTIENCSISRVRSRMSDFLKSFGEPSKISTIQ